MKTRGLIWLSLFVFVTFPYLVLISQFSLNLEFDFHEFIWVFKRSFFQSFVSASLCILIAFFLSFGLRAYSDSVIDRIINFSSLVPFFMPPLFVILSLMAWIQPFPMGIWSVIAVHVFLSLGYCSLQLARVRGSRLDSISEISKIMGVSRWLFQRSVFFPLVRRDIGLLWLLIFFQSFSSFAIPLLIGGGQAASLEILIYELIRIQGNLGAALSISLLQGGIVMALGYLLARSSQMKTDQRDFPKDPYFMKRVGYFFPFILFGMGLGLLKESSLFGNLEFFFQPQFLNQIFSSLILAFGVSCGVYLFLLILGYVWEEGRRAKFFLEFAGPTPALTGFSILICFPTMTFGFFFQSIVALVVVSLPFFMKSDFAPLLKNLENQRRIGRILGASSLQTFVYVVWPQLHSVMFRTSALVGIWAMGDFSVSRLLATRDHTVALHIESLVSHYRLDQAIALSLVLILFMIIYYFLWKALEYVCRQIIKEKLWFFFH